MNESYWQLNSGGKRYPALEGDLSCGILVIGGGLAGLTAALLLARAGCEVALLEARQVGSGTSGKNTGKLTAQHGLVYTQIAAKTGLTAVRAYYKRNQEAIRFVEETAAKAGADVGLQAQSAWLYAQTGQGIDDLRQEFDVCRKAGIPVHLHRGIPLPVGARSGLEMEAQAQYNPKRYLDALAALAAKEGVRIFEETEAVEVKTGSLIRVRTSKGHTVSAGTMLVCSHYPFFHRGGVSVARLVPQRSYLIAAEYHGEYSGGMYLSVDSPSRSVRLYEEGAKRVILIGGNPHRTGDTPLLPYAQLERFAAEKFDAGKICCRWSAQDYITFDGVPIVGQWLGEKNIFFATGFNKWGNTGATAGGILLSELILRGGSAAEKLYSPRRTTDVATFPFASNALATAGDFISGKLRIPGPSLPKNRDSATVALVKGKRCGCYRDLEGKLYVVDLTCTHLGCELSFNAAQRSWDCPCHGSRFATDGSVIEGPAVKPLKRYDRTFGRN